MSVIEIKKRIDELDHKIWMIEVSTDFLSWDDKMKLEALRSEKIKLEKQLQEERA